MLIAAPFVVVDLVEDIHLTDKLMTEAQVISVPLVNRKDERRDSQTGKYLCYVELPNPDEGIPVATQYLRQDAPAGLDSLQIYVHPALIGPSVILPRIIEVPADQTWKSVFQAVRGRSIISAVLILCLLLILWLITTYIAIRGYFFIKNGPRKRPR
ncbi:MAG: hypothetical protein ABIS50_19060 [Luteolibacter sp.]|uniref:hypothetical protein n=1 Tax=Luteolibacter sp. TaxID=1962973 RepID=UPI0032660955